MNIVLILLAASTLLGLATGLVFKVWANLITAPLIAVVSAIVLHASGFKFAPGALVTVACLFVSQLAYIIISSVVPGAGLAHLLVRDTLDDEPDDSRQRGIPGQQEKRDEQPSRPSSPEA